MSDAPIQPPPEAPPVTGLVPMIRVEDIERSADFYRLLGFEIGNRVPRIGQPTWVWLYQPKAPNWKHGANLMLVRGNHLVRPDSKMVLFYLYATDLVALHKKLSASAVQVSAISYPDYLPAGEFQTADPDGYTLMMAQSGGDTP